MGLEIPIQCLKIRKFKKDTPEFLIRSLFPPRNGLSFLLIIPYNLLDLVSSGI